MTKTNGKWGIKKKFFFAGVALGVGSAIALKVLHGTTSPEGIAVVLGAYGTFCAGILALIFAADVTDKKLNGGKYDGKRDAGP